MTSIIVTRLYRAILQLPSFETARSILWTNAKNRTQMRMQLDMALTSFFRGLGCHTSISVAVLQLAPLPREMV